MSRKIEPTPQKEENLGTEGPKIRPDRSLLGLTDAAVKELIRTAKKRGYVAQDEINALLALDEVNSKQIESILAKFSELGINAVERPEVRPEDDRTADDESEDED